MLARLIALAGLAALAACVASTPQTVTRLGGDAVALQAPSGFCIDGVASRQANDFAVLAPCLTLGVAAPAPDALGIVTVQVGDEGSGAATGDEAALARFLSTEQGRALLSKSGTASDIRILSTQAFNDQVMVHFTDSGAAPIAGLQSEEWRAFRRVDNRLVTIGVRGLADAPLREGQGAGLLKLVLAGVSAAQTPPPVVAEGS